MKRALELFLAIALAILVIGYWSFLLTFFAAFSASGEVALGEVALTIILSFAPALILLNFFECFSLIVIFVAVAFVHFLVGGVEKRDDFGGLLMLLIAIVPATISVNLLRPPRWRKNKWDLEHPIFRVIIVFVCLVVGVLAW